MSKLVSVIGPVGTRSGYGSHARDIVLSLLDLGYDVKTLPIRWGNTPQNALDTSNERDKRIIDTLAVDGRIDRQPDMHFHISVPIEFQQVGKVNIGITAGVEWTIPNPQWVDAMNFVDYNLVPSHFVKDVFTSCQYDFTDPQTNQARKIQLAKPIDVLFEGYDENIYKKTDEFSESLVNEMSQIDNEFCFLYVGHWLPGPLGHDRKDTGMMIKAFLETFKNIDNPPALVLKTSQVDFSPVDKYEVIKKIEQIKSQVGAKKLPKIYFLHGELSDVQMNELYNHPKVKAMISFTKGEGFGRPLLEFSTTGKPVIAPAFSGHVDFLNKDMSILLAGSLTPVHEKAIQESYRHADSKWFTVDYNQGAFAMKEVYLKYDKYLPKSYLQRQFSENFTLKKMTEKLGEYLGPIESKISTHVPVTLPKLKKK